MRLQHVVTSHVVILAGVALAAGSGLAQTTWYVDDDACPGPGSGTAADPFCKIQDGINAAVRGDTVLVLPGTYLENIALVGKGITLRSDGDGNPATHDIAPDTTIIDGQQLGSVVTFTSTSDLEDSVLEGFTITNGQADYGGGICCNSNTAPVISRNVVSSNEPNLFARSCGGGIYCCASEPVITENTIRNNLAAKGGGIAIACGSAAVIKDNTIAENDWALYGGGIYCDDSFCLVLGNLIAGNMLGTKLSRGDGGGLCCQHSVVVVDDNVFANNSTYMGEDIGLGGGISCVDTTAVLDNNTLVMNMTRNYGGGLYIYNSTVTLNSCILWANEAYDEGDQIYGDAEVAYCDVQGGCPGIGNIDSDPLFTDSDGPDDDPWTWEDNDLHLLAGSPCIDAGAPGTDRCTDKDYFGNPRVLDHQATFEPRIDMGAHEVDHVHLEVTGNATPGSTLTFTTSGTPAFHVWLFVGTAPGAACFGRYGALFLDFSRPWLVLFWGRIPLSGSFDVTVAVPATMPVPTPLVFQELGRYAGNWGNTSNPVEIAIQ
ncbi:MAG: right-handed parallel beta-helix repeat-containing protein [Planctomycetota bacterium]